MQTQEVVLCALGYKRFFKNPMPRTIAGKDAGLGAGARAIRTVTISSDDVYISGVSQKLFQLADKRPGRRWPEQR